MAIEGLSDDGAGKHVVGDEHASSVAGRREVEWSLTSDR
jgi:hypothetical protein